MTLRELKKLKNKLIIVDFWDHALLPEVVKCRACGWVVKVDKRSMTICYWDLPDSSIEMREANNENYAILTKSIIEIRVP